MLLHNACKRWILAFITLVIICQHFTLVYGVSTDSEAEESESDDDIVGVVEPDNEAEQQIVNEEALRMKAEFKPPKRRGNDNYESFLGLHKSHDTAMKSVDQMLPELGHQMMFANAADLVHLKEVTKLVLFLKNVLQIIKDKKEKSKIRITHMKEQMNTANPDDLPKRQLSQRIEAEQRELDNLREGQKRIKTDLSVIKQAKEDKKWCFLTFITERKSNCAAYNNVVTDWMNQTLSGQPEIDMDRWEFINGHLNGQRVIWKMVQAVNDKETSIVFGQIKQNPSSAAKHFFPESLRILRLDVIMEMNVRNEFMAVATNAMRNYAALSEAMDREENGGYAELFLSPEYFHPAIKCTKNFRKEFDNTFDVVNREEKELDEKIQANISNGSKAFGRFMNNNIFYPNRSGKRHTKEIEKTIEDYSFKTLIAPTRLERNRAMEVLKVAIFLREFLKAILPQNPDETREIEAEKKNKDILKGLHVLRNDVRIKTTQIQEMQKAYETAKTALEEARTNAHITQAEKTRREVQQRALQEAAEFEQAQRAANRPPVSPFGSDSEIGDEMANNRRRRRKRNDDDIENEDTARAAEVLDMLQQNIEFAKTELVDLTSRRVDLEKESITAQEELYQAKERYQDDRKMAKKDRVYLDKARDGKGTTLRDVLNEIEGRSSTESSNDAFKKWKSNTQMAFTINLPNYVADNGQVFTDPEQLNEMQRLLAVVQLEARNEFQKVASHFLPNYAILTHEMTANEVRECARQMNWFKDIEVELDEELVASNGSLDTERKHVNGYGITVTWLHPYSGTGAACNPPRRMKGTAEKFASAEETQQQFHGAKVPLTSVSGREQAYNSEVQLSAREMESDSELMTDDHFDAELQSEYVESESDVQTIHSNQFLPRQNPFTQFPSLSSQQYGAGGTFSPGTAPHAYTESETDSSFVSKRNKSKSAHRAAPGTSRMRPTTVLPQHGGSDSDTSFDGIVEQEKVVKSKRTIKGRNAS